MSKGEGLGVARVGCQDTDPAPPQSLLPESDKKSGAHLSLSAGVLPRPAGGDIKTGGRGTTCCSTQS